MTRTLSAVALGLLAMSFSGPSNAADLSPPPMYRKAPAYQPVAPVFSWQGFYAGFNGGYGFGNSTLSSSNNSSSSVEPKGALLGSTLGYNFQADTIVYGIEGDIDYSWMKDSSDGAPCSNCDVENHYLATVRGRLGYAMNRWMPYVTGGAAFGDIQVSTPAGGSQFSNKIGWTLGGGIEYALNRWNMSAKLEYLYADLGSANCDASHCGTSIDTDFQANIVRLGLNFHY